MDLSNSYNLEQDAERGASYTLLNPYNGEKLDVEFVVRGVDSPTHDKLQRLESVAMLAEGDDYDIDKGLIRIIAGLLIEWKNIEWKGDVLEFNTDNAIFLLSEKKFIFTQLKSFIEKRKHFFIEKLETEKKS